MTTVKKWALPGLTVLMVLAAIVLPQQLSSLRDLKTLDTIHTQPLSEDDLAVRELPLPEKLAPFSTPYCRRGDLLMEFFDVIARRGS